MKTPNPSTPETQDLPDDFDPFAGPVLQLTVPSTEPQREVWTGVQMGPDASCAFNESMSVRLQGPLDVESLRSALQDLVEQHEALRSTFSADGLTLCVAATMPVMLDVLELDALPSSEREARVRELVSHEVETPLPLESGPLMRPRLVKLAADQHLLTLTAHHIVCDGWSMAVMLRDLATFYSAQVRRVQPDITPAPLFSDYALAQQQLATTAEYAAHERYWLQKFSGTLPVLELPLDKRRPPSKTYSSRREDYVLEPALVEQLKRVGARHGGSFFTTLLAGFKALLHRLTGLEDVVVAIPAAGQSVAGLKNLVGHCVNALPLRSNVSAEAPFTQVLKQLRTTMLDAYEHQEYTFGTLLKQLALPRDPSRLPLVNVLFNVDQAVTGEQLAFQGLTCTLASNPRHFENFDLFINAAEAHGRVVLECQYNTDLFEGSTVRRWMACYEELLRGVIADAETPVARLPLLPEAEKQRVLVDWNATTRPFNREAFVHTLVAAQAQSTPDAVALRSGATTLTYRQLVQRGHQVAHALKQAGVTPGSIVGLFTERGPDMVVGLLGILQAGAGYVPLDPGFPPERLAFMVEDAKLSTILTQQSLVASLPSTTVKPLLLEDTASQPESAPPALDVSPEEVAYVIYTSGSTGKPKGVRVPHRAVVNFLGTMQEAPGLTAQDVLLAVTTLSFDIAVLELFLPLTTGAQVVLASRETASDGALLKAALESNGVTVMQATPSTWRLLLEAGWQPRPGFKALCGGEALPRELAEALLARVGSLWNMYGPTETTVWSTTWRVQPPLSSIRIGRPIANTQLYLLDAHLAPVPVGVAGELYIGGDGVTLGYLHRPELTQERFLPNPFRQGERMYRTGDLARWLADGTVEYLGRNDSQVKLRGFRIELGEVEAALASHPSLAQAVALVREDRPGDRRLVAYLIARPGQTTPPDEALRAHLKQGLPEYMVPQHFVALPALPLTPNGKVDRKALPSPQVGSHEDAYVAPRDETEQKLADIFADVLGLRRVSVTADFFRLGGHSLLASQALTRASRDLDVSLTLRRMFEAPTVEKLARLVRGDDGATSPAQRITPRAGTAPAPLSLMQQRLWFLEQLNQGTAVYNLPAAFRIFGELDVGALTGSFNMLLERHSALRTFVRWDEGTPVQHVEPSLKVELEPVDLEPVPANQREEDLLRRLQALADESIPITAPPLFRLTLFRLGAHEHVLFFMPHHLIWDGWSFDVFLRDLDVFYAALTQGKEPKLPALPIQYADFTEWHRNWLQGEELERQARYWRQKLSGNLPALELPTDKPRPAQMSLKGGTEPFVLTGAEVDALTKLGRESNATLYMVLLTAFKTLLHRYSGQEDLVVGTPIRGRSHPEVEDLLGFFVNTLVLRTQMGPELTFRQLLERVRTTCMEAFGHQDMPIELLLQQLGVQRDLSRTPLFQTFFTFQDVRNRNSTLGALTYGQVHVHAHATPLDLSFWVKETAHGIVGGMDYNTDLFERDTVVRMLEQIRTLLRAAVSDAEVPVARLPLLPEAEKQRVLVDWNATTRPFNREAFVHTLVAAQAQSTPDAVALRSGATTLTYRQLVQRGHQVAHALKQAGVTPGSLVGLFTERGPDMVVGLLGILQAGAGYVPLDPGFPPERLAFMVEDAQLSLVLTQRALQATLPSTTAKSLFVEDTTSQADTAPEPLSVSPEEVAYVIYTSGSTGKPKGVRVPHRAVVNFLGTMQEAPGLTAQDVLLAVTTLSFDIAVLELFLPLTTGAQVVLASRDTASDGPLLKAALESNGVTVMQATPSTWRLLLEAGWQPRPGFKALCGGEALPRELAEALLARVGSLWNMYGPTETTVWSTTWRVQPPLSSIRIGRPIANTQLYLLDAHLAPVPVGVAGELYIGGDGVTLGYLHRPELTQERFLPNPFRQGERMYRTGDLARWLADGTVEYLGRNDSQVKLRGFRIELGEVEAALASHPSLAQAVALVREDRPGDRRLVAYLVSKPGQAYTDTELRKHLRSQLPQYMVPQHFVELEALPLTPNGKVDRKALPPPAGAARPTEDAFVAPRTEMEKQLARIWREVLGIAQVGVHDNFFNIGGHSLLSFQVVMRVQKELGQVLHPRTLLLNTLEQVASQFTPVAPVARPTQPATPTKIATPETSVPLAQRLFNKLKGKLPGRSD
ncbi:amino acid adenylation domain-containing protein [Corallococcus praedator]|uniref:Amino acid adenylation domain-containing protein n=1 Tax=Corallococcus praedator TaxID=2316724 RepID=A0ABX9QFA9_9BACT|nr:MULTISPECIES: non-ribosomal peptide synthetase [Corallococcus]RKH33762.1 amino acid adenylation domain-containing protein [Corallococcus sp. CA031C]RKI06347.1 amino acid adenylation domain-containing protein [Corallococcus praedator]